MFVEAGGILYINVYKKRAARAMVIRGVSELTAKKKPHQQIKMVRKCLLLFIGIISLLTPLERGTLHAFLFPARMLSLEILVTHNVHSGGCIHSHFKHILIYLRCTNLLNPYSVL